jgi:transcriptional regulator with XRE-family HTH domain
MRSNLFNKIKGGQNMVNKFRLARMRLGKKQIELAKQIGIHPTILSQFECGWRIPTPRQLKKLIKALPELKEGLTR